MILPGPIVNRLYRLIWHNLNAFAEYSRRRATGHSAATEKVFLSTTTINEIKIDEIDDGASDAILPGVYSDIEALEGISGNDAISNASEQHALGQSGSSLDQMDDQIALGVEKPAQPSLHVSIFPSNLSASNYDGLILRVTYM